MFHGSVQQNVEFGLKSRGVSKSCCKEQSLEMLERLKCCHLHSSDATRLSSGERRRVALARAIIREPEILLYDEPTSGLDPVMSRHVDEQIISMQQSLGVTSIVVTHDLHSAFSIGDRIAMLHEGRVAEIGPPEAFAKSSESCVQEFIRAQFESGRAKLNPAKGEMIWQQSDTSASASV